MIDILKRRFADVMRLAPTRTIGQRLESSLGLLFYNARFYDPSLARFIQAETDRAGGVQGLDRYAYSYNNPVKYTFNPTVYVSEMKLETFFGFEGG